MHVRVAARTPPRSDGVLVPGSAPAAPWSASLDVALPLSELLDQPIDAGRIVRAHPAECSFVLLGKNPPAQHQVVVSLLELRQFGAQDADRRVAVGVVSDSLRSDRSRRRLNRRGKRERRSACAHRRHDRGYRGIPESLAAMPLLARHAARRESPASSRRPTPTSAVAQASASAPPSEAPLPRKPLRLEFPLPGNPPKCRSRVPGNPPNYRFRFPETLPSTACEHVRDPVRSVPPEPALVAQSPAVAGWALVVGIMQCAASAAISQVLAGRPGYGAGVIECRRTELQGHPRAPSAFSCIQEGGAPHLVHENDVREQPVPERRRCPRRAGCRDEYLPRR